MPLFGRRPRTRMPPNILAQLQQMGRSSYDPQYCESPWSLVADMYQVSQADRDGFLADLAAVALPADGWPVYGAMKLVLDILGPEVDQAHFNAIVLAGLNFLRSHGVPNSRLSPNEMRLWRRLQGEHTPWLVGRPVPPDRLTPLLPGEMRRVAQIVSGPHSNILYVRQHGPDRYVAIIDGEWSEEESRRVQNEWLEASSLHELYARIADAFQTPSFWADPELEPYFPLPPPTI